MTRPFRVLLVGCGGISREWLGATQQLSDLELVGLVDLSLGAAEARAAEFGLAVLLGTDLEALLARTKPDVVFNCTVPEAHFAVTTAALEAGAHVFSEKPLASTLAEAEKMIQTARASGKVLATMQNRRYDPTIRMLRDVLQGGVIGDVTTVYSDFFIGAHFGGFRDRMPHVLLKDMAIHTFDAARFLTGARARSVYALEWNPAGSWYEQDASAAALFELTGGVVYSYRGSWCAEGLPTSWEGQWRIVGTKGTVIWDRNGVRGEVVTKAGGFISEVEPVTLLEPEGLELTWHGTAVQTFIQALREGRTPETHAGDNFHSLQMVLGAVESSEKRSVVNLE